jgi:hypothetical protein
LEISSNHHRLIGINSLHLRAQSTFRVAPKFIVYPRNGGDGYDKIKVIGRHRGSKQFVTMIISADQVTNWRAKVVYDPEVLRRLDQIWFNWQTKAEVEAYLESLANCASN